LARTGQTFVIRDGQMVLTGNIKPVPAAAASSAGAAAAGALRMNGSAAAKPAA
jgi:hypothetical protein